MQKWSEEACGLIIRACCRAGSLDQAMILLRESRQRRLRLNNRSIQHLMVALGRANRNSDMLLAHSYLEKREVNGYNTRLLCVMVRYGPHLFLLHAQRRFDCSLQVFGRKQHVRPGGGDHPAFPLQGRQDSRGVSRAPGLDESRFHSRTSSMEAIPFATSTPPLPSPRAPSIAQSKGIHPVIQRPASHRGGGRGGGRHPRAPAARARPERGAKVRRAPNCVPVMVVVVVGG
jgi:hypothetical protein